MVRSSTPNTPRQIFILRSLGYPLPQFAHLPFVAEPGSKNKLSKRKLDKYLKNRDFAELVEHGRKIAAAIGHATEADAFNPVIVDFYREVGYLPWAIDNYLALLGWSLDDKTEFFTRDELVRHFTLERINSSPASFYPKKLWAVQDHYMARLSTAEKLTAMLPFLAKAGLITAPPSPAAVETVRRVIEASGDRLKVAGDILALNAVSFRVDDGEFFTVVGPNGSGKTTLFNVIAGVIPPSRGVVFMEGRSLNGRSPRERARARAGRSRRCRRRCRR